MGLVRQVIESLGIPIFEVVGRRGRRRHRHARHRRAATRATTSSSSPATATATSSSRTRTSRSSTTSAACPTTRSTTRPGIAERTGVTARPLPAVRRAPRRPVRQPAGRARGGGEDGRQAHHHLRRPRRHLRAPRRADPEAAGEPRRARGQRAPEPRGDGPRARRPARAVDRRPRLRRDGHRRRRGPPPVRLPRVQHPVRPAGRGPRHRPRARRRPRRSCSRRRSRRWPPPTPPSRRSPGSRAGDAPLALAAAWAGEEGRSALEGLALVRDGDAGDVRVAARASSSPTPRCRAELGALAGIGGRPLAAHQAKPLVRALTSLDVDVRSLALDTALAAYLLDPAESRYLLEELRRPLRRRSHPRRRRGRRGPARPRRRSATPSCHRRRPAGRWPSTGWSAPLLAALDAQGLRVAQRRDRGPAGRRAGPHGGRRRRASTGTSCRPSATGWSPTCERHRAAIVEAAGHEFNVNSTPQLREVLFDELGLTPQKKTKTGFSTDAASLEKLAGQHPIIEHLLALPRGREAALHLRRGPARRRSARTAASTPRSTRPSPAPAGSRRISRTCTTSRCGRSWAASSARRSSRPRAASCSSPTTTRSSCAASPTSPRTRG